MDETTGGADVVGVRGCAVVRDRRQPAALHVELLNADYTDLNPDLNP